MSHRYTGVEIIQSAQEIQTTSRIWSIGSCFSDNMSEKLMKSGFDTLANPYGVLYNPVSIADGIQMSFDEVATDNMDYGKRGDIHFSYQCHSELAALSKEQLLDNINNAKEESKEKLLGASHILITLGTSIVHELSSSKRVVANCHKMIPSSFSKRMLRSEESFDALADQLERLKEKQIILTVSPVRHTKEGLVQNQRSKARLLEVAHLLAERFENVSYFPAYELVLDELRDYRYFAQDLIHPSTEAVDFVWERFQSAFFSVPAKQKVKDVFQYRRGLQHKAQFPESTENLKFVSTLEQQREVLLKKYPELRI